MDQQNDTQSVQPGSLGYVPTKPENPATVESIVPEAPSETNVEKAANQEIQPSEKSVPDTQTTNDGGLVDTINPQAKPSAKVVDKSSEPLKLHHIQSPKDELTKEADEEEEKFITEVETAHGHK